MPAKLKLLIFLTIAMALVSTASASTSTSSSTTATLTSQQVKLSVDTVGVGDFWGVTNVEQNQYIQLKVTVGVHDISPVPLDGFWIKVTFTKPSGSVITKWFDFTNEYISKGYEKTYSINTGVKADEVGTWHVTVELYTKDKQTKINSDSSTFQVTKVIPAAYINIQQIVGYGVAAAAVIGTPLIIRRFT